MVADYVRRRKRASCSSSRRFLGNNSSTQEKNAFFPHWTRILCLYGVGGENFGGMVFTAAVQTCRVEAEACRRGLVACCDGSCKLL